MIENFIRTRISFIEDVITQDGYNGADKALWELYGELKIKLKEVPILSPHPETKKESTFIPPKGDPTKLTDEEKAKIKKLVQDGDKPSAISRKLGIPAQRLYYWIDKIKTDLRIHEKENAKSSEQASK
jgi:hypothetical protein